MHVKWSLKVIKEMSFQVCLFEMSFCCTFFKCCWHDFSFFSTLALALFTRVWNRQVGGAYWRMPAHLAFDTRPTEGFTEINYLIQTLNYTALLFFIEDFKKIIECEDLCVKEHFERKKAYSKIQVLVLIK